ncbi:hypothetical protein [Streptomyces sp. NPDC059788]|uniref:hypothetical protein n=1 Tax=Streptomyces sp. NPDC059788 TaxID=3346948 RepID=UPI0036547727
MQDICTMQPPEYVRPVRRLAAIRRTAAVAVAGALLAGGVVATTATPAAAAGTCSRSTVPIDNGGRAENVFGTVNSDHVNLRTGPGTGYAAKGQLNGWLVPFIARCTAKGDTWLYVHVTGGSHKGSSGWIARRYATLYHSM